MRKQMKKRICFILLSVIVFLNCVGCYENEGSKTPAEGDRPKTLESIVLNKDIAEISERDGILKVDSIMPGLDTYSFDTLLFDLEKGETLCEVSFEEGAWLSGLTENGFYVIDTLKKEVKLYDKLGNITKEADFSSVADPMNFCALSENERYFVYSNFDGSKVTVVDLTDNSKSSIELPAPLRDMLSFEDHLLRAVSLDGQVFELNVQESGCTFLLQDTRIRTFSSNYCLGETETNFLLENKDECIYVPISSADEVVIGMGESVFATVSLFEDQYMVRFYDLEEKTISYDYIAEPVERLCYTDGNGVLAVTGSSMEKRHKIVRCNPGSPEELLILSQDTLVHAEPEEDIFQGELSTPKKSIENVPVIAQFPGYPTGCESVTAVMALNYSGNPVSVEEFVDRFLPTSRDFYIEDGVNYGPSPYEYFIGNPKSSSSYGCMAPVIEKAINDCIGDSEAVKNITGVSLEEICAQYIDRDVPVIMWATINMLETNPKTSWYLSDGKRFTWPGNEHCMLLVGYDDAHYYFNDPYAGKLVAYEKTLTEDRFAELGSQALVILPQ